MYSIHPGPWDVLFVSKLMIDRNIKHSQSKKWGIRRNWDTEKIENKKKIEQIVSWYNIVSLNECHINLLTYVVIINFYVRREGFKEFKYINKTLM